MKYAWKDIRNIVEHLYSHGSYRVGSPALNLEYFKIESHAILLVETCSLEGNFIKQCI